jgi:hypothetical protein
MSASNSPRQRGPHVNRGARLLICVGNRLSRDAAATDEEGRCHESQARSSGSSCKQQHVRTNQLIRYIIMIVSSCVHVLASAACLTTATYSIQPTTQIVLLS